MKWSTRKQARKNRSRWQPRRWQPGMWFTTACLLLVSGCVRDLPPDGVPDKGTVNSIRESLSGDSTHADTGTAAAEPTGFATFSGLFKLSGSTPSFPPLPVRGDDATMCAPSANSPLVRPVAVGPNRGLANVVVFLDMKKFPLDDDRWIHPSFAETAGDVLTGEAGFDQKDCVFLTRVFTMRSTQTLDIMNSDPKGHNTNIAANGRARQFNQLIPPGAKIPYTPGGATKGVCKVGCNIHDWMGAYIFVSDHPYYAVTDENGRFEIPQLPTGVELTFRVWQEKLNNVENVKVGFDGDAIASKKWSRGKFILTLTNEKPSRMDVEISSTEFSK